MVGFEIASNLEPTCMGDSVEQLSNIGVKLQTFFNNRDLLVRPLGNTIYVMPPYCVTESDLDAIPAFWLRSVS